MNQVQIIQKVKSECYTNPKATYVNINKQFIKISCKLLKTFFKVIVTKQEIVSFL